jgi:hypothetical protein
MISADSDQPLALAASASSFRALGGILTATMTVFAIGAAYAGEDTAVNITKI